MNPPISGLEQSPFVSPLDQDEPVSAPRAWWRSLTRNQRQLTAELLTLALFVFAMVGGVALQWWLMD